MPETMMAGVLHAIEDLRYEEIEKPVPKAGEVLVKVKFTGICGSDVPRVNGTECHYFPNVLGHEFSGVIAEVGEGVTALKPGDRVAGVPLVPCMKCPDCLKGNFSLCRHYSFVGSRRFGSFAEYVCVPEANVVRFSEDIPFEQAALFEPATVALHGLERADYAGGHTVAILGTGPVGMLTMQFAKIFGAAKVVAFDIVEEKLALALELGADAVVNTLHEDFMEEAMALTGGAGYDYVYETSGSTVTMKLACQLASSRARVCYIGTPKTELTFSVKEWETLNRKELTLTGSWMSYSAPFPGHEWTNVAHFFASGQLRYDPRMIWKVVPLSGLAEAFRWYQEPGKVKGKILVDSEK